MRRSDRRIAIAALLVATLALVMIYMAGHYELRPKEPLAADSVATKFGGRQPAQRRAISYRTAERRVETFDFDPNTADSSQLLRLGLQPWQVRNIYRYRARGGIYRTKEDFARVYGLTVRDYRRLEPHIRISADYRPAATLVAERTTTERDTLRYPVKLQDGEHIVLNTADTAQLKRVPGIGSYYARQVVRYGQRLGGYVSIDQLDEIEDFPQEAKRYMTIDSPQPKQLNINKLTLNELKRHPYLNYYQAKAITDYRRLHGPLHSLDDLRLSRDFTAADLQRLKPYVSFE
jgi:DNA uptake protein ComE-like DNA-binding protein